MKEIGNRTDIYRFFDKAGQLLYVGVSKSAVRRLLEHATTAYWFDSVATILIEKHATRLAAEMAEVAAIQDEKPKYNVAHAPAQSPWFAWMYRSDTAKAKPSGPSVARCSKCYGYLSGKDRHRKIHQRCIKKAQGTPA